MEIQENASSNKSKFYIESMKSIGGKGNQLAAEAESSISSRRFDNVLVNAKRRKALISRWKTCFLVQVFHEKQRNHCST